MKLIDVVQNNEVLDFIKMYFTHIIQYNKLYNVQSTSTYNRSIVYKENMNFIKEHNINLKSKTSLEIKFPYEDLMYSIFIELQQDTGMYFRVILTNTYCIVLTPNRKDLENCTEASIIANPILNKNDPLPEAKEVLMNWSLKDKFNSCNISTEYIIDTLESYLFVKKVLGSTLQTA